MEERLTIQSDIEEAYLATVHQCAVVLKYIHSPRGSAEQKFLNFSTPFYELYQHTLHIPAVAEGMKNDKEGMGERLGEWFFSTRHSADMLKQGMKLFSQYQKILIESRVITLERQ